MKLLLCALAAFLLLTCPGPAADRRAEAPPKNPPAKTVSWNVRVEVLMVAMPQEKALALLPDLRAPEKIEAAVEQIFRAIDRKEATLTGYPVVHTLDGQRAVTETIFEKRYPVEFELPASPAGAAQPPPARDPLAISDGPPPTAFETRNLGATLEVEPQVIAAGDFINLNVVPQRVALVGFDSDNTVKTKSGAMLKVDQPQFTVTKTTVATILRNGERKLLAVHKLFQPENQIEFFIIQATATAIK